VTVPLLKESLVRTVEICANIIFIIYAAYVFSHAISYGGIGEKIVRFVIDLNLTKTQFLIALFLLYTVLGCLIESLGMIVITVPLLHPVVLNYGIDPILFGILLVIYIELGQISPPIGINLFVIQSIWDGDLSDVVLGTIPFHIIMFLLLALVMIFPDIAMWLPTHMK
jgi:TRAP-type C4-dicarboxylate transport system permease large subunit